MQKRNFEHLFKFARDLTVDAGEQIRTSFQKEITVDFKENRSDLVTNMDKQIERFFIKNIQKSYPDHRILGEEGFGDKITSLDGTIWIIDPIDGTMNFVHMQRHFAISVAIYHNGEGIIGLIYDVAQKDLYYAVKGQGAFLNDRKLPALGSIDVGDAVIGVNSAWVFEKKRIKEGIIPHLINNLRGTRSFGSAAIELAYTASGKIDGYISLRLSPWDYAAGKILIEEVGGKISTINGDPLTILTKQSPVFAAKPGLHEAILKNFLIK